MPSKNVQTEINFVLGKNEIYVPSSLGSTYGRLIVVVKQADKSLAV